MSPSPHSFHYRASAHAFSGNITRPFQQHLEIQAPITLPSIGGHGHSSVENFQFRELFTFKKGYTHVSGSQENDGSYNTLVTATVEGLNVFDVLTADRIVARLHSKHGKDVSEGEVSLVGSKFENLRILGCRVDLDIDFDLFENALTFEKAKSGKLRKIGDEPLKSDHIIASTCIKELKIACPGVKPLGHGFHIKCFGNVFFGEVLIKHGEKTITMIRLEMGSAVAGSGTVVEASSNGSPYPPTT
jgi:hypothetical protein